MVFPRRTRSTRDRRRAGIMAVVVAIAMGVQGVFVSSSRGGLRRGLNGGDIGSMRTLAIFAALIAVPIAIYMVLKLTRGGDDDDHARTDDMNAATQEDLARDEEDERNPRLMVLLAAIVAIGIALAAFILVRPAHAQGMGEVLDRGAFVVAKDGDTLVVDRFTRTADTLRGSVLLKGQARVDYVIALGPGNVVRTMLIKQYKWAAPQGDIPTAEVLTTMQGDSAIIQMGGNTTRIGTKAGAIPGFNNAFAISELFTRRARATGGTGDYSYLAINGGVTVPLTVRPIGADSLFVTIAGQEERFLVDGAGRILGGSLKGQPVLVVRASAADADKITFGNASAKPAEKPDYSAPAGAPYTAEEVSFKGPGGITLGGTLTKPKSARGPLPAVITITGSGQQDRDEYIPLAGGVRVFRQVADTLSRVGIAVLRLDDRGMGASTGSFANSNTADFADDTRAALAWLRTRADIDPNRLALLGHSEGGIIAPMVAATDAKLRAIVVMAGPAQTMTDIMMSQNKWVADHNPKLSEKQRDSVLAEARAILTPDKQISPAVKFWLSYDPEPAARNVKAATLILQGATDRQVPAENAEKLAALIRSGGNQDVTVRVFPSTDHLFLEDPTGDFLDMYAHVKTNKVSPVLLGALANWLVLKLAVR